MNWRNGYLKTYERTQKSSGRLELPFKLIAAVAKEDRFAQMAIAVRQGLPRLQSVPIDDSKSVFIACYGPSLKDTWNEIFHPIISMSGATHFLAERGINPDYHIDMDTREHKLHYIDPPVPGVHYLMSSVCPPRTWDILRDEKVTLWHSSSGEGTCAWILENDPEA